MVQSCAISRYRFFLSFFFTFRVYLNFLSESFIFFSTFLAIFIKFINRLSSKRYLMTIGTYQNIAPSLFNNFKFLIINKPRNIATKQRSNRSSDIVMPTRSTSLERALRDFKSLALYVATIWACCIPLCRDTPLSNFSELKIFARICDTPGYY